MTGAKDIYHFSAPGFPQNDYPEDNSLRQWHTAALVPAYSAGPTSRICTVFPILPRNDLKYRGHHDKWNVKYIFFPFKKSGSLPIFQFGTPPQLF